MHPESGLTAEAIVRQLKENESVPEFLKKSLVAKNGAIVMPANRIPKAPKGTFSFFLKSFVDALRSPDWQITTATSKMVVKGQPPDKLTFSQIVTPHLSKQQRLGRSVKTGPDEKTFSADVLESHTQEVVFGWTVPASSTEQLKTKRGLIVIVTKITVTNPKGKTKDFTPSENEVLESVMHEISAHAGRITKGKPDEHGTGDVQNITEDIARFFRLSEKTLRVYPYPTATSIFQFVGAKPPAK